MGKYLPVVLNNDIYGMEEDKLHSYCLWTLDLWDKLKKDEENTPAFVKVIDTERTTISAPIKTHHGDDKILIMEVDAKSCEANEACQLILHGYAASRACEARIGRGSDGLCYVFIDNEATAQITEMKACSDNTNPMLYFFNSGLVSQSHLSILAEVIDVNARELAAELQNIAAAPNDQQAKALKEELQMRLLKGLAREDKSSPKKWV